MSSLSDNTVFSDIEDIKSIKDYFMLSNQGSYGISDNPLNNYTVMTRNLDPGSSKLFGFDYTDNMSGSRYGVHVYKSGGVTVQRLGKGSGGGYVAKKDVAGLERTLIRNEIKYRLDALTELHNLNVGNTRVTKHTRMPFITGLEPVRLQLAKVDALDDALQSSAPAIRQHLQGIVNRYTERIQSHAHELLMRYVYEGADDNALERRYAQALLGFGRFSNATSEMPHGQIATTVRRYGAGLSGTQLSSMTRLLGGAFLTSDVGGSNVSPEVKLHARTLLSAPAYSHTMQLYNSLISGIKAVGINGVPGIQVAYDESKFAGDPYWVFVEKGHKVVMPKPVGRGRSGYTMHETGGTVAPKPIMTELKQFIRTVVVPEMQTELRRLFSGVCDDVIDLVKVVTPSDAALNAGKYGRVKQHLEVSGGYYSTLNARTRGFGGGLASFWRPR